MKWIQCASLNLFLGDACDGDQDGDGVSNHDDNCRLISNAGQEHVKLNYDAKGVCLFLCLFYFMYGVVLQIISLQLNMFLMKMSCDA